MRTLRDFLYYIEHESGVDLDRPLMINYEGYGIEVTSVYAAKFDKDMGDILLPEVYEDMKADLEDGEEINAIDVIVVE